MDQLILQKALQDLTLGALRYFGSLTSTNDLAARWAQAGAPDLALVVADEQTAGRGRMNRRWFTPPGVALAFSLILKDSGADRPQNVHQPAHLIRYPALGAVAVCEALNQ